MKIPIKITSISVTIFGHQFEVGYRMFEWHASLSLIGVSIFLFLPGEIAKYGTFRLLHDNGFTEEIVGSLFFLIGWMRVIALGSNGLIGHWSARLRAFGAMFGAVVWAQLAISLVYDFYITGRLSAGIAIYISLTIFDMMSAYRAGADARAVRDAS